MNIHTPRPLRVVLCAACLAAAVLAAAHSSAAAPDPAAPAPPARAVGAEKDAALLLDGVGRLAAPGAPGPLCVFGDKAFAVVAGKSGEDLREPVVAAARLGAGRVVAFGHDGYFEAGGLAAADTGQFMLNAVRWA
ncbi:MAG: hypothetical protein IMZ66_08170, partial [Planctomycetes bacterium]|nr:hypothetical protein [Planctomycetota bacterium]